jgi:co-chaperonin GroES (HSP10)
MMNFKPVNRHLQIELVQIPKDKTESSVLLPENYNPRSEQYKLCRVVAVADDCAKHFAKKTLIAVNASMIEQVKILEKEVHIILENHVVGIVNE